jgi:hypothetical protein
MFIADYFEFKKLKFTQTLKERALTGDTTDLKIFSIPYKLRLMRVYVLVLGVIFRKEDNRIMC